MAANESWFRREFRASESSPTENATQKLSRLRAARPASEYEALVTAFRTAAPKTYMELCLLGPRSTSGLVYRHTALVPLSLENELRWAGYWLRPHFSRLNAFRSTAAQVQALAVAGQTADALALVDAHVATSGWSLWAVEIRAALMQKVAGTPEMRDWLRELQSKTVNSVPGLLFEILGDRNDDTYSHDAFYAKCMSSFPRFESVAPWMVDYLKFRTLSHVDNSLTALPNVLCRDISSSLIDYYEDVLETLSCVETELELKDLRPLANELVLTLLDAGHQDHRLRKFAQALGIDPVPTGTIHMQPEPAYQSLYFGRFSPYERSLPPDVAQELEKCENEGARAYEAVGRLLKWGINHRGLDVGPAVALCALRAASAGKGSRELPLPSYLLSETTCVDDAAALSSSRAVDVLRAYLADNGVAVPSEDLVYKPSVWNAGRLLVDGGPLHLWLATRLLERKDYSELDYVLSLVREKSPYWDRQVASLEIEARIQRGDLAESLNILQQWYRRSPQYALEFPAEKLFAGRKWSEFKSLDPVEVGLVSHFEHVTRGDANVSYICKMACRSFLLSRARSKIGEEYEGASLERRQKLVAFLRDVWIEPNLSLCDAFESTAAVRKERMAVLQLLLSWDEAQSAEYAEEIKDLTFDQTLQKGLQQIDQTRIFVNESAITRWADKELEQDYERWRRLAESSSGGRAVDDMLRQYVLDPSNTALLKEFTDGKPTAADALLIDLIARLYTRFLLDPTDGLDTYLSVRIRHGSLRGTVLGPLEEQSLLYSTSGFSEQAFESRWGEALALPPPEKSALIGLMQGFSSDIRRMVDTFVDQRVQVQRAEKLEGAFPQIVNPAFAKVIAAALAERPTSFHAFLYSCYFIFWKLVEVSLKQLQTYVKESLYAEVHDRIDRLIDDLRRLSPRCLPLVTTLRTASTMTRSQCDTVAEWFRPPSTASSETYQLPAAIEIASASTRNVHRAFAAEVSIKSLPAVPLPLTTSGLAVLTDCLFVVFENAWKHSGLSGDLPEIELFTEYDASNRLLTLRCRSALSESRRQELVDGELTRLRTKYLGELPLELIRREGGSGFPKLARLTRTVPSEVCPTAFSFGLEDRHWFTSLTVPLYEREGAFETYE